MGKIIKFPGSASHPIMKPLLPILKSGRRLKVLIHEARERFHERKKRERKQNEN